MVIPREPESTFFLTCDGGRPTHHIEVWSDICNYPYTTMGTSREKSSGNVHTIERQEVLMAQLSPTWQFTFESLMTGRGDMSKQCRDNRERQTSRAPSGDLSVRSAFKATYNDLYQQDRGVETQTHFLRI
jgi:hypothetical protein